MGELTAEAEARCRAFRLEPPTPDRVARIVGGAVRAYDERRYAAVQARLAPDARARLEALVRPPPGAGEADDTESGATPEGQADARPDPSPRRPRPGQRRQPARGAGQAWRRSRRLGLPAGLFADCSPAELELCRRRVAVKPPSELRRHPEATRLAWLAAYAHLRGRAVTDALVELLIETVHHIGARAEHRVEQELLATSSGSAASRPAVPDRRCRRRPSGRHSA